MNLKNNGKNKISSDIALNRFSGLCPSMTNEGMDTRVKPEYDEWGNRDTGLCFALPKYDEQENEFLRNSAKMTGKDNIFLENSPSMTNEAMDTRVKPEYDKKKISSLNPYPLSSSDLIGGSTEDEVDMNIMPNGCPIRSGMTIRGISSSDLIQGNPPLSSLCMRKENTLNFSPLDTEQENSSASSSSSLAQENSSHLSSLVIGQENVHLLSCSNLSHLSSSDLIGGSIKDEGGINTLSQTKKSDIPSNNLLQQKEYDTNSNNLSQ